MNTRERAELAVRRRFGRDHLDSALVALVQSQIEGALEEAKKEAGRNHVPGIVMSEADLQEIEARLDAISGLNWKFQVFVGAAGDGVSRLYVEGPRAKKGGAEAAAEFCTFAPTTMVRLLGHVRHMADVLVNDRLAEMAAFELGRQAGKKEARGE